jgi:hypothetical protein
MQSNCKLNFHFLKIIYKIGNAVRVLEHKSQNLQCRHIHCVSSSQNVNGDPHGES